MFASINLIVPHREAHILSQTIVFISKVEQPFPLNNAQFSLQPHRRREYAGLYTINLEKEKKNQNLIWQVY